MFTRKAWIGGITLDGGLVRIVQKTIVHPSYDDNTIAYDYMILRLNATALYDPNFQLPQTVEDTETSSFNVATTKQISQETQAAQGNAGGLLRTGLTPIAINRNSSIPAEDQALTVMGFGLTDPNDFGMTSNLNENVVYAVPDDECELAYRSQGYDSEYMMCAGHPRGGADTCQGDSGGPMVDKESQTIVGVTSWGEGCGDINFPGVYAQVDPMADWIDEQICLNSCYPPDTCDPARVHPCSLGGGLPTGPVEIVLQVTFDTYPSEFGAILTHYQSDQELLYIPYDSYENDESPISDPLTVNLTVSNLPAGIFYLVSHPGMEQYLC
jgi:Trypsin